MIFESAYSSVIAENTPIVFSSDYYASFNSIWLNYAEEFLSLNSLRDAQDCFETAAAFADLARGL